MLAVIDTNVLISRFLSPHGAPAGVFDRLRHGQFDLLVSTEIITEYAGVLRRDGIRKLHRLSDSEIQSAIGYFLRRSLIVIPPEPLRVVQDDPKDDKFIECTVAGGADAIVSGDKDLLALGAYGQIRIVTLAEFLAMLDAEDATDPPE